MHACRSTLEDPTFRVLGPELRVFFATLPYLLAIRLSVFARYGLFRGYWRHVGLRGLVDLGVATTLSSALFAAFLFVFGWPAALPRSVFVLDWLSIVLLSGALGLAAGAFREDRQQMHTMVQHCTAPPTSDT